MASRVMNSKFGKTVRETVVPELGRMASEALQNYVGDKGAIGKMVGDIGQIGIDEAQDWAMPKKEPPMKEQTPLDRAKEIAHNIAAEEIPIPRESIMTPKMKEMEALLASLEADPKAVGSGVLADLRAYVASQRGKK
jgi:predicted trehalose synthase